MQAGQLQYHELESISQRCTFLVKSMSESIGPTMG